MSNSIDNPFFARLWTVMSAHEPESIKRLRRENLADLSGRVLEVGAGTGTNFELYPDAVTEVVAVEPERRLAERAQQAAAAASVPVTVSTNTVEQYVASGGEPFDAVVCSLVLCSVDEPGECTAPTAFAAASRRTVAVPGTRRGYRRARATAEGRRRHAVAADRGQLPHPSAHRRDDRRRGLPGGRSPARMDDAALGAPARSRVRDRPRGQALAEQRGQPLQQPGQRSGRCFAQ